MVVVVVALVEEVVIGFQVAEVVDFLIGEMIGFPVVLEVVGVVVVATDGEGLKLTQILFCPVSEVFMV